MRITGTLQTIGTITTVPNFSEDIYPENYEVETIKGILITANDDMLRAASNLLCATVDIYPHAEFLPANMECTPENFAHALARLAHAEDHLAREVRSSQALADMSKHYQRLLADTVQAKDARIADLERAAKERSDSDAEEARRREREADEKAAAWVEYLDLRQRIRRAHEADKEVLVTRALDLGRLHRFDPLALEKLQAEHDALARTADDLRTKLIVADYIAGKACQIIAECSNEYMDGGRDAQAIMCEWDTSGTSAGELAARRVVASLSTA